jgi:hypothetical protein
MCPSFRVEGSMDACCAVASLLEVLDFTVRAFRITNDLGSSDECGKNSTFL